MEESAHVSPRADGERHRRRHSQDARYDAEPDHADGVPRRKGIDVAQETAYNLGSGLRASLLFSVGLRKRVLFAKGRDCRVVSDNAPGQRICAASGDQQAVLVRLRCRLHENEK